jgi:hypothetical protein
MGLGGPVWHTSVRPRTLVPEKELRRMANKVLEGVGDKRRGEWQERHESLHVRRRLSAAEEAMVGPVLDIRRTAEAIHRAVPLAKLDLFKFVPDDVLAEELGADSLNAPLGWIGAPPSRALRPHCPDESQS